MPSPYSPFDLPGAVLTSDFSLGLSYPGATSLEYPFLDSRQLLHRGPGKWRGTITVEPATEDNETRQQLAVFINSIADGAEFRLPISKVAKFMGTRLISAQDTVGASPSPSIKGWVDATLINGIAYLSNRLDNYIYAFNPLNYVRFPDLGFGAAQPVGIVGTSSITYVVHRYLRQIDAYRNGVYAGVYSSIPSNIISPIGLALRNNRVYLVDRDTQSIWRRDPGRWVRFAYTSSLNRQPRDLVFDDTHYYVTDGDQPFIFVYSIATNAEDTTKRIPLANDNSNPRGIMLNGNDLHVVDNGELGEAGSVHVYGKATKTYTSKFFLAQAATLNVVSFSIDDKGHRLYSITGDTKAISVGDYGVVVRAADGKNTELVQVRFIDIDHVSITPDLALLPGDEIGPIEDLVVKASLETEFINQYTPDFSVPVTIEFETIP